MVAMTDLRAWWAHCQGLDGALVGASPSTVLSRAGWARSVGGSNPYLSLFARARLGREAVDAAVAALEVHELPSARGCTYVLPAADYGLGLACADVGGEGQDMRTAMKLGVTHEEIARLEEGVVSALADRPMDPRALKEALGGLVRNLGDEGKKRGLTTTLPIALGRLQTAGRVRRVPMNGRLDNERYLYAGWQPSPRSLLDSPSPGAEALAQLAERYFAWIGAATLAHFQWFSGAGVKSSQAAVAGLGLEPIETDAGPMLATKVTAAALRDYRAPVDPCYRLVGSLDSVTLLRRDVANLVEPEDAERSTYTDKGAMKVGGLSDLWCNAILDRGRLVGLWEFDPDAGNIAWASWVPVTDSLRDEVALTEAFVRDDLGDARSFSLDSPKSRRPRIEWLRSQ
jgi:hypothetical protein